MIILLVNIIKKQPYSDFTCHKNVLIYVGITVVSVLACTRVPKRTHECPDVFFAQYLNKRHKDKLLTKFIYVLLTLAS